MEDDIYRNKSKKAVEVISLYKGNQRAVKTWNNFFLNTDNKLKEVGQFKFLFVREDRPDLVPTKKITSFL